MTKKRKLRKRKVCENTLCKYANLFIQNCAKTKAHKNDSETTQGKNKKKRQTKSEKKFEKKMIKSIVMEYKNKTRS